MKYWKVFFEFFKIGLFTFGGGLAMIPFIQKMVVEKNKWMDEEEMINMIAIAESTPGVIAVNCATYVGHKVGKLLGAICATLGVVLPSFTVICIVSIFYEQFMQIEVVKWAFMGIKACVSILILNAGYKILKKCPRNAFSIAILLLAMEISLFVNVSTALVILGGLIIGVIFYTILNRKKEVEE